MHPAFSVILFTVLSGAGYGLFAITSIYYVLQPTQSFTPQQAIVSCGIALVLISIGLISSTFHLANPRNAWRAFSRVRTSWLAREGVLAVAFYPLALGYLYVHWQLPDAKSLSWFAGFSIFVALWAFMTIFSTGMIYACLKTIRQWHNALTPINYILLGTMLGGLLFLLLMSYFSSVSNSLLIASTYFIFITAFAKIIYFFWIGTPAGPTINTATSFTQSMVRLLDVGHTAGTFLTDEFGYQVARAKLIVIRWLVVAFGFVIPIVIIWFGINYLTVLQSFALAAISAFTGVVLERWLFFAEARHVVNLYHGTQQC